ncbi:hypothetical protein ACFWDI_34370 [Streptomyces sp. NPDC060064]|uniref:hypothetical protein n=1 Tax=Streptomyces sp. NPDC060064 TaxID=3347049 RepID=UPI0036CFFBB7
MHHWYWARAKVGDYTVIADARPLSATAQALQQPMGLIAEAVAWTSSSPAPGPCRGLGRTPTHVDALGELPQG